MKRNYVLTVAASIVGLALVAFTTKKTDGDLIKVSVVHHSGTEVLVMDTVFDPATGYSVEQFLLDKGLDPDKTDIINTDNLDGAHVHNIEEDIWYMDEMHEGHAMQKRVFVHGDDSPSSAHVVREEIHGEGNHKTVKITETIDDEGNVVIQKFVNGEEVEYDGEEGGNTWIEEGGMELNIEGENVFFSDEGDEGKVIVLKSTRDNGEAAEVMIEKIKIDAGEEYSEEAIEEMIQRAKELHGEDAEHEQVIMIEEKHRASGEGAEEMEVELEKIIDEEGEHITMWVNGEEVDPAEYEGEIDILHMEEGNIEIIVEGDMDSDVELVTEDVFIIKGDCDGRVADFIHEQNYTLALVSTVSQNEDRSSESVGAAANDFQPVNIRELNFYPNPSTGEFRLSFSIPEKGKTQIEIYNMVGQKVYAEDLGRFEGQYNGNINISDEGPGTYILTVVQGNDKLVEKVIVQ